MISMTNKDRWLEDNFLIAGRTKSGKSYHFEHEILPNILEKDYRPVIILDYKNQYRGGSFVNLRNIPTAEHLAEIMNGVHTNGRKVKYLRIISRNYNKIKIDNVLFRYLCQSEPKIFVMEEGHFYFEELKNRRVPYWTKTFFRTSTGEHNIYEDGTGGHNCILITQYPNDIPSTILNAFNEGHIFYLPPKSLKYLYDQKYFDEDWKVIQKKVSPMGSYRFYDVGKAAKEGHFDGDGEENEQDDSKT